MDVVNVDMEWSSYRRRYRILRYLDGAATRCLAEQNLAWLIMPFG